MTPEALYERIMSADDDARFEILGPGSRTICDFRALKALLMPTPDWYIMGDGDGAMAVRENGVTVETVKKLYDERRQRETADGFDDVRAKAADDYVVYQNLAPAQPCRQTRSSASTVESGAG